MKRLLVAAAALVAAGLAAFSATLPQLPSSSNFSEASQIVGTLNALIAQLNGGPGYTGTSQIVSLGVGCTGTGTTTATCTGQRGLVTFTAVPATALGASSGNLVQTNTGITTASICVYTPTTNTTALLFVSSVVPTANTLTVVLGSSGAYAGGSVTLAFVCM